MTSNIDKCDMCGSKIENGKCNCGEWYSEKEMKHNSMKKALEEFHEMKRFTMTADMPHLGCAMVCFRGNYNDCQKVQRFIYELNNRHFYSED